ncbi:TPA_asm: hypothetical protein GIN74_06355 [Listeria monocytogenes]|nr:hypothetical protein [Listeria monocytogenes]
MGNLVSSDEMWVVTPTPRVGVSAKFGNTQVRVEPRKASLYQRGFFCWLGSNKKCTNLNKEATKCQLA